MSSNAAPVNTTSTPDGTRVIEPVLGGKARRAVLGALHTGKASPKGEQAPIELAGRRPSRSGSSEGHAYGQEAAPSFGSPKSPRSSYLDVTGCVEANQEHLGCDLFEAPRHRDIVQ